MVDTPLDRILAIGKTNLEKDYNAFIETARKIDPSKSPKELDLHFTEEDKKGKVCLAIYELDGDKLTICTNTKLRPTDDEKRPNVFSTKKPGERGEVPGKLLFVLERQKK